MSETNSENKQWWGTFKPESSSINYWQIGPSQLWITRYPQEWRIAHQQEKDANILEVNYQQNVTPESILETAKTTRYSFRAAPPNLYLNPVLADRPMVIKPHIPFYVQTSEEVTLYFATSVWLELKVNENGKPLLNVASFRPSDTWFGTSTIEGELCYASTTQARLRLEDMELAPHRAITALTIKNRAKDALFLERIKIPVQYLSVFEINNALWTQSVTLTREQTEDSANLQIAKGTPKEAGKANKLSNARQQASKNLVVRAFSKLFGESEY